jgi:hypothetical protein
LNQEILMTNDRTSNHAIAMLIGGIAAGMVGSRLLAPLLAMTSGTTRVKAGGDPFALLIDDHRKILSTLDQMLEAPSASKVRRMRLFLALKRTLGKHALAEEDVVYPLLLQDHSAAKSKELYDEHADIKTHLFEIEQ